MIPMVWRVPRWLFTNMVARAVSEIFGAITTISLTTCCLRDLLDDPDDLLGRFDEHVRVEQ